MPRPKRPKPDANQAQTIEELRGFGFCVWDLSRLGGDVLDILVGGWDTHIRMYRWVPFELKTKGGRLTKAQRTFFDEWMFTLPMAIAYCTEDILRYFGRLDE